MQRPIEDARQCVSNQQVPAKGIGDAHAGVHHSEWFSGVKSGLETKRDAFLESGLCEVEGFGFQITSDVILYSG